MGNGQMIDSGHVLCVGGLVLSVGGFYSVSRASAVFVFFCCIRVFGAFGAEGTAANGSAPARSILMAMFCQVRPLFF